MPAVRLSAPRLLSLDIFRGLTVGGMLLVNNPGSWEHIYPPLEHAAWNGWTPTDLVFPFFLFIVGVAIPYALGRRLEQGAPRGSLVGRILFRAALIVALGVFLNAFPRFDWHLLRLPGVLQRIGLVYACTALVYLWTSWRVQALICAVLLASYWLAMMLVPVPGVGAGSLLPDANLAQYLDSAVFGVHMWREHWDPEGLLSTIPAIGTALFGVMVGTWLRSERPPTEKALGLLLAGGAGIVLGMIWDHWFPINKNLWTSSYAVFTAGIAAQVLGALYAVADIWGYRRWAWPSLVLGSNALLVFGLSGLLARVLILTRVTDGSERVGLGGWIYMHLFVTWAGPLNGSLAYAVAFVLLFIALLAMPYRRGWYLRF
jgi:predicted acyltransferase